MKKIILAMLAVLVMVGTVDAAWGKKKKKVLPRVMLMITEKTVGGYSVDQAEITMSQYLIGKGFTVIDQDLIKAKIKRDQMMMAMNGDKKAAVAIGLKFDADVVIVGRAIAKGSAERIRKSNMRSYQATVTAKAIKTDTAEVIATEQASNSSPHLDDTAGGSAVLKTATEEMIKTLHLKIAKALGLESGKSTKIQVLVGGVSQVWQLAAIKRVFEEKINGVENVIQRDFVSGVASFDVEATMSADDLSKEMVLLAEEDFKFKVIGMSAGKIDAKFLEK